MAVSSSPAVQPPDLLGLPCLPCCFPPSLPHQQLCSLTWPHAACLNPGAIPSFLSWPCFSFPRLQQSTVGALPLGLGATLSALCPPSPVLSAVCLVWGASSRAFPLPLPWGARAQEVAALIPCTWLSLDHWGLEREGLGRVGTLRVPLPSRFSLVVPVCTHGIVHGTVWQHWPGAPQHRFAMLSAGPFL